MSRREMFSSSAAMVAFAVMAVVSILATLGAHPVGTLMVLVIGVAMTMITIDSGGHSMLVFSGGFLLFALGLAIGRLGLDGPVPWAFAGVVVLAYADAVRLCFAMRRHGVVEVEVYRGVFVGLGIVVAGAGATAALVVGLGSVGSNANWLLVPLALVLATIGLVGLAIAVSRSPGQFDKRRWKPGERLMAPARSASDDPSLKTSTPPPPTTLPTTPNRRPPPPHP